jgi:hypothetical protein
MKSEMLYIAVPLIFEAKQVGILRTSIFIKDINHFIWNYKMNLMLNLFLVLGIDN